MSKPPAAESDFEARARGLAWFVPLLIAAAELVGHLNMRSHVPSRDDWRAVGRYVGAELRPRDQVLVAPAWADPLLREQLGDRLGLHRVGELDLEPFERVFVVSLDGHGLPALARHRASSMREFGALRVELHRLGPSPVLYDFVERWGDAEVVMVRDGIDVPCRRQRLGPRGGGLGQGAYWPADRVVCDAQRPWLFFAPTVSEDRDLALRHCLFQHPSGPEPIRVTYRGVPLGERLVIDADIYYEHERNEQHGVVPFELRVIIDGHDVGTMRHYDGQGRKRMVLATGVEGADPWRRGTVVFETTSADPSFRTVCWSGSTRTALREEAAR